MPRFIARIFLAPLKLLYGKWRPERKREIIVLLTFYMVVCIGVSALYSGLLSFPEKKEEPTAQRIEKLAKIVAESPHRGEMRSAAAALAAIGEPAVDAMLELIKNEDLYVRWYTADRLGNVKSNRTVQPLIDLLYDKEYQVRRVAAYSLGRNGSMQAVEPLIEALKDPERDIAIAAARSLAQIGDRRVVQPLIEVLEDTTLNASGPAAEALAELGATEAIEPLKRLLEGTPRIGYHQIGWALWKLGDSEKAVEAFLTGLQQEEMWYNRGACASALGKIKSKDGVTLLIETLRNEENNQVRRSAILALLKIKSEQSIDALGEALNYDNLELRMYAAEALRQIGTPRALQVLKRNR